MRAFDCTASELDLWGNHLLEASAGTGKTFAIEHVFCRLILEENPVDVEEILTITFTRAAARELKNRIRTTLLRVSRALEEKDFSLPYLRPLDASLAKQKIEKALARFEFASISTIHGFCYRSLKEFSFEAEVPFSLSLGEAERLMKKKNRAALRQFLENSTDLSSSQLLLLLREHESWDGFVEAVEKIGNVKQEGIPFSALCEDVCRAAEELASQCPPLDVLLENFREQEAQYKKGVKGDLEGQVLALFNLCFSEGKRNPFDKLLKEKGSIFVFLSPENRKIRADKEKPLAPFFMRAKLLLAPLIERGIDVNGTLKMLQRRWREKQGEELDWTPDVLIEQMAKAVEKESFCEALQKKYRAVIVDEFQDTDPVQWALLEKLFVNSSTLRALYLVGDPKQSIYRFRSADVYTYLAAKKKLGEEALYSLNKNYRSIGSLVDALNALFSRIDLPLPKLAETMPIPKVESGGIVDPISDGKKSLHAWMVEGDGEFFASHFLPRTVEEIKGLLAKGIEAHSIAILVKDRHQAALTERELQGVGISAFLKSPLPLGETPTFRVYRQLLEALLFPQEPFRRRLVEAGPLSGKKLPDRETLQRGLTAFFSQMPKLELDSLDEKHLIEELLLWEKKEGFSMEGLVLFLRDLSNRTVEEGGGRLLEVEENALSILTLHASKGLEYDVVFAVGLASSQPREADVEEQKAEQLRQLYVAMTRAKKRLYFSLRTVVSTRGSSPGDLLYASLPPLSDLSDHLEVEVLLAKTVQKKEVTEAENIPGEVEETPFFVQPRLIRSFTSMKSGEMGNVLRKGEQGSGYTIHTLPKGAETGIAIHTIFERLFSRENLLSPESIVAEELAGTPLLPWEEIVIDYVKRALHLPFLSNGGTLLCLKKEEVRAEVPFLYGDFPHATAGVLDLLFLWEGRTYFLDWKTNWLGPSEGDYEMKDLLKAMEQEEYFLQARLYAEAVKRYLRLTQKGEFGGAYYLFFRGPSTLYLDGNGNVQ